MSISPDYEHEMPWDFLKRIKDAEAHTGKQCCCGWGAAVSGEYPEFGCARCPIHQGDAGEIELCRRHARSDQIAQFDPHAGTRLPEHISRCWQNDGFHVYGAGPCFDTLHQAQLYKSGLDEQGVTWRPQT